MRVYRAYNDTKLFSESSALWVESSMFERPFFIILCTTTCQCLLCTIYTKRAALYWSDRYNIRKQWDNVQVFGKLHYWLQQSCAYFKASPLTIEIRPCMYSKCFVIWIRFIDLKVIDRRFPKLMNNTESLIYGSKGIDPKMTYKYDTEPKSASSTCRIFKQLGICVNFVSLNNINK